MTRPKDHLPGSVSLTATAICRDALAIVPMYARLVGMGAESPRGESVHVSGGSHDPTGELAMDTDEDGKRKTYAESRRAYARWVASELSKAAKILNRVEQGLERNVGPGAGYRQSVSVGSDAIVSVTELSFSLERQADRLRAGNE